MRLRQWVTGLFGGRCTRIHTHALTQTDRQTDTHAHAHTDTHTRTHTC
jgi:hypothetical protein